MEMNHQGGDFCLENKLITLEGRISMDTWRNISCGLDVLEGVHENLLTYSLYRKRIVIKTKSL